MEHEATAKRKEFFDLTNAIRKESVSLQNLFLTKEEQEEHIQLIDQFHKKIEELAIGTLRNLTQYQLYDWRKLTDGGDDSDDGTDPAERAKCAVSGFSAHDN